MFAELVVVIYIVSHSRCSTNRDRDTSLVTSSHAATSLPKRADPPSDSPHTKTQGPPHRDSSRTSTPPRPPSSRNSPKLSPSPPSGNPPSAPRPRHVPLARRTTQSRRRHSQTGRSGGTPHGRSHPPLPPTILARIGEVPQKKSMLVYGHFDVQLAAKSHGWDTEPLVLTEEWGGEAATTRD
jgi:hypothetical protein